MVNAPTYESDAASGEAFFRMDFFGHTLGWAFDPVEISEPVLNRAFAPAVVSDPSPCGAKALAEQDIHITEVFKLAQQYFLN